MHNISNPYHQASDASTPIEKCVTRGDHTEESNELSQFTMLTQTTLSVDIVAVASSKSSGETIWTISMDMSEE
jgi:hypothetical protein